MADGQWYLHLFDKAQPDVNWKNPDIHEEFKKTLRFWSDHGTDGFRIDVAHGLAKDLESKPLEELGREYSVVGVLNHDFSHPLFDRREVHDIYREWRKVFNEYNPPRFAVAEAWVVPEHQHLYASMDELGQSFNFDFAQANWYADEFRKAIAAGLKAAAETGGSTTTWVMNNHDVPRSPSRYGLPQVKGAPYHQLPHDWLLRNGTTYPEDRELGTRRARAAALMELGLPGAAYIYQARSWVCLRWPIFRGIDWRIRPLSTPLRPRWIRAVTVAACLCLGPLPTSPLWPISAVRLRPTMAPARTMCRCAPPASSARALPSASPLRFAPMA